MGINNITATFNNLPTIYNIKNNTLSSNININYASLQITSNNVVNNQVSINANSSITLSISKDSLSSFKDASVNLDDVIYQ
ncbi:hypothetical protein IKS57_05660 [bacterium]|nr:hypothetical protein [bacterium]